MSFVEKAKIGKESVVALSLRYWAIYICLPLNISSIAFGLIAAGVGNDYWRGDAHA